MPNQDTLDPQQAFALPSFRSLYGLTCVVALLVVADVAFWLLGYEQFRSVFGLNLSLIAAVLGGARIVYSALIVLLDGDVGADLALAIAMVAALLLREYFVAAEVVLIAMIGESLEAITFSRTNRELRRILELQPRIAHLRENEQTVDVPIDKVHTDQIVVVRPGERIPVDGTVVVGRSCVDQSTLTGESLPIDKAVDDPVYAGTINQFGALDIRVEKVGERTTLGQVIQLVADARRNKSQVERVADRLARYFLPFVLILATITFVITNYTVMVALLSGTATDQPLVWMPTLAVLVVTCPCALVLATPAAVMAALAWLARRGVLTTGGAALERLAQVDRIAFDKTGTLTEGKLQLGDITAFGSRTEDDLLRWAASAEQKSEHLIAQTIVQAAAERGLPLQETDAFQALPGAGIEARLAADDNPAGKESILIGNRRLIVERGLPIDAEIDDAIQRLEESAQTALLICHDNTVAGVIGVRDTIRPDAANVITQLRELGIDHIAMLTGDRPAAAKHVASQVGIDLVQAELRPAEKAQWLAQWPESSDARGDMALDEEPDQRLSRTAMVGDGVNDAPALAQAGVGIALGGVGSDIAAEAGDLILMGDPLKPLPGLLRLARETVQIIRQNIILFAFIFNFLGIVLTAWVMPTWSEAWLKRSPVAAALFHQLGSLLVLLNSMRLLWFGRRRRRIFSRLEAVVSGWTTAWMGWLTRIGQGARMAWQVKWQLGRVVLLVALALYLSRILIFVQPDEVAVVKRFGQYHAVLQPGAHLRLPPPWDTIRREKPHRVRTVIVGLTNVADWQGPTENVSSTEAIQWNTEHAENMPDAGSEEALMLTGDKKLVELAATIQYRISDVVRYQFGVREPDRMFRHVAESVIRETVATKPLLRDKDQTSNALEILTVGRGPFEEQIRDLVQARCDHLQLGLEILPQGVCLQEVHPPRAVVSAFRDVSSAYKERAKMKSEADAYYREQVIGAAGSAAWIELAQQKDDLDDQQMAGLWNDLRKQNHHDDGKHDDGKHDDGKHDDGKHDDGHRKTDQKKELSAGDDNSAIDSALLAGQAAVEMNLASSFAWRQKNEAEGDANRFQLKQASHASDPELTEWRLFLDALIEALPGKKKLILDTGQGGRRHLILGVPQGGPAQMLPVFEPDPAEHE